MSRGALPDFALEVYFSRWEFTAEHNLAASDAQTLSIAELLELGGEGAREAFDRIELGYIPTWGTERLRAAIASTYESVAADDVLAFAGAEEGLFWAMRLLLEAGDHAVVTVPNYQSMESVPVASGVEVSGLPIWTGEGPELEWTLDLDRLGALLRPTTRLVAVNFPNNPTGFAPDAATWRTLVELCEERSIRLFSDEVYRGLETDPGRTLPQAADLLPTALSLNVMSKAYGLPGLRVGWIACRDRELLGRLERAKHYTSICNAGPSEHLAALALEHRQPILERNRRLTAENGRLFADFAARYDDRFEFTPPDGGCVAFPRYAGPDGVESFCRRAVEEAGVLLLPASVFRSRLAAVPADRFRAGLGRTAFPNGLAALERHFGG